MCGIAGFAFTDPRHPVDAELLRRMTDVLAHRGPDAGGVHVARGVGLGHRRLSIIDLSTGDQPIFGEDRAVCTVFNGEIYNFQALVPELEALGHRFTTRSDTETIVHAYEQWGPSSVARLHGMFAFALWDEPRRRLVLARDRAGKKPLYYAVDGERLIFGSEIKSLLQDPALKRRISPEALADYLTFGHIPSPATVFQDVHQIPPAHVLIWEGGRVRLEEYWDVRFEPRPRSEAAALDELEALLADSVRGRMISDVPLGAFLSGGVDSSTVVAAMTRQSTAPVVTVAVGFAERTHSELAYARAVASHLGTDHHELLVRPRAIDDVPRLVWHLDQPFADSSALPTYYVSKATRERVTVALSGDGGDELFAGYTRRYGVHRLEQRLRAAIPEPVRRRVLAPLGRIYPRAEWIPRPLRAGLVLSNLGRSFERAYVEDMALFREDERAALLTPEFRRQVAGHDPFAGFARHFDRVRDADPLSRVLYVDFKTWLAEGILVKVDRMSMACSLEVRAPLLDHRIVEFAATLPPELKFRGRVSKYLLKRALERHVPPALVHRPKQGFEIPLASWLRGELREVASDLLLSPRAAARGYVEPARVAAMWRAHQGGHRNHAPQLWALMVLELWLRAFVDAT